MTRLKSSDTINVAVITLKITQRNFTTEIYFMKIQNELQTVKTLIRLLLQLKEQRVGG